MYGKESASEMHPQEKLLGPSKREERFWSHLSSALQKEKQSSDTKGGAKRIRQH